MTLVDTHCHLSHLDDPDRAVTEARDAGVAILIDIGMGVEGSEGAAARATSMDGVYASVGIHPNDLEAYEADPGATMARIAELATGPRVVGVGETGIDRYRDRASPKLQEDAFRAHIALAKEVDRTLVIHCRDAHDDVLRVLDDAGAPGRVVMHCFSGDVTFANACDERGFYCSFAGNLTFKRNDELRAAAAAVREELLLVETDAPFLAPVPHRGKPNRPAWVAATADVLASVRGLEPVELGRRTTENARRAFAL